MCSLCLSQIRQRESIAARRGMARLGVARLGMAWQAGQGQARPGAVWQGRARLGGAGRG